MGQEILDDLLGGFLDDLELARITLPQGRGERLGLLQRDMRRQGRDVGIGIGFEHHGTVRREGLLPRRSELFGTIDEDAFKTELLRIGRVAEIRNLL